VEDDRGNVITRNYRVTRGGPVGRVLEVISGNLQSLLPGESAQPLVVRASIVPAIPDVGAILTYRIVQGEAVFLGGKRAQTVVTDGGGIDAALPDYQVLGKTGTAQVKSMRRRDDDKGLKNWHPDRDHAWFASFAPSKNPEIAFVVLLEHGGAGGRHAGPVGRQIVEAYHKNRQLELATEPKEGR